MIFLSRSRLRTALFIGVYGKIFAYELNFAKKT